MILNIDQLKKNEKINRKNVNLEYHKKQFSNIKESTVKLFEFLQKKQDLLGQKNFGCWLWCWGKHLVLRQKV